MKQTAVEQLGIAFRQWQKDWQNYEETGKNKPVSYDEFIKPFLEMEKQQKGYSEEEVYHILCEHTAFLFAGGKSTLTEWFETVKKK